MTPVTDTCCNVFYIDIIVYFINDLSSFCDIFRCHYMLLFYFSCVICTSAKPDVADTVRVCDRDRLSSKKSAPKQTDRNVY